MWPQYDSASVDALEHPSTARAPTLALGAAHPDQAAWPVPVSGDQIYPGPALMGDRGRPQVAVMRFREMPQSHEAALTEGMQAIVDASEAAPSQDLQGFRPLQATASRWWSAAQTRGFRSPPALSSGVADHLDLMTFYIPYWRRLCLSFEAQ